MRYKINKIFNKFLLAGDKFMPEMYLRQLGFAYSASGPFTKNKGRIQKFKETGYSRYIQQNELGKACFWQDMAFGNFKDLNRKTASDKILRDKSFNIATNMKNDGYQCGLASMVYNVFEKNLRGSGSGIKCALSGLRRFLAIESHLKMMKMFFISPQKLFSFSNYLSFSLDFLVM